MDGGRGERRLEPGTVEIFGSVEEARYVLASKLSSRQRQPACVLNKAWLCAPPTDPRSQQINLQGAEEKRLGVNHQELMIIFQTGVWCSAENVVVFFFQDTAINSSVVLF